MAESSSHRGGSREAASTFKATVLQFERAKTEGYAGTFANFLQDVGLGSTGVKEGVAGSDESDRCPTESGGLIGDTRACERKGGADKACSDLVHAVK